MACKRESPPSLLSQDAMDMLDGPSGVLRGGWLEEEKIYIMVEKCGYVVSLGVFFALFGMADWFGSDYRPPITAVMIGLYRER